VPGVRTGRLRGRSSALHKIGVGEGDGDAVGVELGTALARFVGDTEEDD
jgi:hypothetical protein